MLKYVRGQQISRTFELRRIRNRTSTNIQLMGGGGESLDIIRRVYRELQIYFPNVNPITLDVPTIRYASCKVQEETVCYRYPYITFRTLNTGEGGALNFIASSPLLSTRWNICGGAKKKIVWAGNAATLIYRLFTYRDYHFEKFVSTIRFVLVAFVQMFFPDFFIFRFVTRDIKYPAGKSIYSLLSPFLFGDTCMYEI